MRMGKKHARTVGARHFLRNFAGGRQSGASRSHGAQAGIARMGWPGKRTTPMGRKRILFIINPISGTGRKSGILQVIEDCLDRDVYDHKVAMTEYAGHAAEIATGARDDGVDVVVAVGGDGTVNEVARAITRSSTALGIIPCGSGNGLARHLSLPMEPARAMEALNRGEAADLDYGTINGHPFFCTCGMGFDALVSMKFAEAGRRGVITYLENIVREGLRYKSETYEVRGDGVSGTYDAFLLTCGNASQYGNNAYIAPQASMRDGLLDVTVIEPFDAIEAPQLCIDIMGRTLDRNPRVRAMRTRAFSVRRERPGAIHYDGDPVMAGRDIEIGIEEGGIKVVINPHADRTKRQPLAIQSVLSEIINDMSSIRIDLGKQANPIQAINKVILKRLSNLKQ